jgi:hypothetical protein
MPFEMCGRLAVECFQKRQDLVCPMACQTFADDGTAATSGAANSVVVPLRL